MTFVPSSSLFSDLSLHTVLEDESLIAAAVAADIKAHFFSHLAFHFNFGEKLRRGNLTQEGEINFIDRGSCLFDKDKHVVDLQV